MLATASQSLGKRSWPRLQLIYFLIAACNIVATICGLYLSHLVITAYGDSVTYTNSFDTQREQVEQMVTAAADMQSGFLRSFTSRDFASARQPLAEPKALFADGAAALKASLAGYREPEVLAKATGLLNQLQQSFDTMGQQTEVALTDLQNGNAQKGYQDIRDTNVTHDMIRAQAGELEQLISEQEGRVSNHTKNFVADIRYYQFLVGLLMALIICSGAYYGYVLGQLLKKKFTELEKTHNDLAESHEQALAFSKEIQIVNQDMGRLNRQLNDNLSKLREAQDEALRKGKMAQLGNLTATVAHELRNPLSTVRTSTFLLARKIKDKGLGVDQQLQRINNGIVRCDNIITQLLDFSRSKAVKLEPIELDAWLEKLIQSEAQRLPDTVSIECCFGLERRLVDFEPGRLERAIINLMSNASEALVGKGDDPKMRYTDNPLIIVETKLTARGAEISVTDNGPGISQENLEKIREPLFTTKNFGTGLGIPAVEQILDQHNGGLDITSEEGRGAKFTLWLPVQRIKSEQAA